MVGFSATADGGLLCHDLSGSVRWPVDCVAVCW